MILEALIKSDKGADANAYSLVSISKEMADCFLEESFTVESDLK